MNDELSLSVLRQALESRSGRRDLHLDLERLRYSTDRFFEAAGISHNAHILYVGVGHGHDALMALILGKTGSVVGVDPYIESDGNGPEDHEALLETISLLDLTERFSVYRGTVQEYLKQAENPFDAVVCADVLHHIFVTRLPLLESDEGPRAVALFRRLSEITSPRGILLVSDTSRHGLRPWLHRVGLLSGPVDYVTKQSWTSWSGAAEEAGWCRKSLTNYVPWAVRRWGRLLDGRLGRYTLCDRYFLLFDSSRNS